MACPFPGTCWRSSLEVTQNQPYLPEYYFFLNLPERALWQLRSIGVQDPICAACSTFHSLVKCAAYWGVEWNLVSCPRRGAQYFFHPSRPMHGVYCHRLRRSARTYYRHKLFRPASDTRLAAVSSLWTGMRYRSLFVSWWIGRRRAPSLTFLRRNRVALWSLCLFCCNHICSSSSGKSLGRGIYCGSWIFYGPSCGFFLSSLMAFFHYLYHPTDSLYLSLCHTLLFDRVCVVLGEAMRPIINLDYMSTMRTKWRRR